MSERILFENSEVKVFKNPKKRADDKKYRASDWPIREPSWKGVLLIITKENEFYIKLNEVASGMPFGKCPVDKYPGPTVETVADSSRYFVIKVANEIGQTAFLGIGFENRSDSVEFTTVLQNHFKNFSKKKSATSKEPESNTCQMLVPRNMSNGENLLGLIDQRPFMDSLADQIIAKYGNDNEGGEVIDLSSMQAVKKRRRSMPAKYAPPKTLSPVKRAKSGSKSITYTKHEVINVRPSSSSRVQVSQTQCTALARLDDSTFSSKEIVLSRANRLAVKSQEFQIMGLNEYYNDLLNGDTDVANLLCCAVHTTLKGTFSMSSQLLLPNLPSHSIPIFRFDKNQMPYFILLCREPESEEAPSEILKDINESICQKSFLIYQLLLKLQSGINGQSEQEQHFINNAQQQKLLQQYLKMLVLNNEVVQAARRHLEALYGKDLPNPAIFDVIVQIDADNKPHFKFIAFPKNAPFDLNDSLSNYDKTITVFSKQIYEYIYANSLSPKTAKSKFVRTRM